MTGIEAEAIFLGLDALEWLSITLGWTAISEVLGYVKKVKANSPTHLAFNLLKGGVQWLNKSKQKRVEEKE